MTSFSGLIPAGRAFRERFSSRFCSKAAALLLLLLLADYLFLDPQGLTAGSTLGIFGFMLLIFVWLLRVTQPDAVDYLLGAMALGLCLALFNSRGTLAAGLLWMILAVLVLRPTFARLADARDMAIKLLVFTLSAAIRPIKDLILLHRANKRQRASFIRLRPLILPVAATLLFGALFIWANPILEDMAGRLSTGNLFSLLTLERVYLWSAVAMIVWSLLRRNAIQLPRLAAYPAAELDGRIVRLFSPKSVLSALILCNAIFALQNGLDIAYLWAGETLPNGLTHAQYAHRGAYPLILTALLAGAFVLIALRRGSPTEQDWAVRALVYLWLAQNVFLIASAILRTLNYVADYSLTLLRLSALIWMGLVAIGIVLIVWRIFFGKSGRWLINANALAAVIVLYATVFADLSGLVANYNVRHSYEATGHGVSLDVRYLEDLGAASLPALDWYIANSGPRRQMAADDARTRLYQRLQGQQGDWRRWTWAGQRLYETLEPPPAPRLRMGP